MPQVAKLFAEAKVERPTYIPLVFRACYCAGLTVDKIAVAIGATSQTTRNRIAACANWLVKNELVVFNKADKTYTINHAKVEELEALSNLGRQLRR